MDNQQSTQAALGAVTAFPAIAPGHHLAPVAIGAPGNGQQLVFVPCPDFCTTNHVSEWVHFLEDVDHKADEFHIDIPSFWNNTESAYQLTVSLASDPMSTDEEMRAAHLVVGDSGSVDAYLTPDMADKVADDLLKLAAKMRETARTARLHNVAESEVAA
ncbi:hypothetical protein [Streptomyces sp. SID8499]|uniref:DUF6907 domain-containing protein n=1 Tax=Streptomyces sp. SID8499 TaxID=2706106 RepID=UPI0013CD419D|nr:hypothetical protein [Streptomyces sp. SID8499]NED31059.1 hypothetical protein [Streptomyces sp. SID8499]